MPCMPGSKHVVREEGASAYRCTGIDCPAQLLRSVVIYFTRRHEYWREWGRLSLKMLAGKGLSRVWPTFIICTSTGMNLNDWIGWARNLFSKLLDSIENPKKMIFDRLIYGFGIRNVGIEGGAGIGEEFDSIYSLMASKKRRYSQDIWIRRKNSIWNRNCFFHKNIKKKWLRKLCTGRSEPYRSTQEGN